MVAEHVGHLVNLLTYVAERNGPTHPSKMTSFHLEAPESLCELVGRLDENIRCSTSCYAVALVYMDRITEGNADLPLNLQTVNLLFTTSLLLANQFLDDKAERALQFARVARVHPSTMARLKIDFLFRVSFSLVVNQQEMRGYSDKLHGRFSTKYFMDQDMWSGTPAHALLHAPAAAYMPAASPVASVTCRDQSHPSQQQQSRRPVTTLPAVLPVKKPVAPFPGQDVFIPSKHAGVQQQTGPDVVWMAARGIESLNNLYSM